MKFAWGLVPALILSASLASAQIPAPAAPSFSNAPAAVQVPPVINPNGVAFVASTDHNAMIPSGSAMLTRYVLEVMSTTNLTLVVATRDLGKPTPVAGEITFNQFATVRAPLAPGSYVARVAAEGPGGRNVSVNTDPFLVELTPPAAPPKPRWVQ